MGTWVERSVSVFTLLNSNEDPKSSSCLSDNRSGYNVPPSPLWFNNAFREQFKKLDSSQVFHLNNRLVEIIEIPENNFFACQYHPIVKPSKPLRRTPWHSLYHSGSWNPIANEIKGDQVENLIPLWKNDKPWKVWKNLDKKLLIDILVKVLNRGMAELAERRTKDPVTALGREGSSPSPHRIKSSFGYLFCSNFFVVE